MKKIIQKAKIKVIRPQIVEYYCDHCGKRCGTRQNPKEKWVVTEKGNSKEKHYCKKSQCHKRD
jgi:hypothetical protein